MTPITLTNEPLSQVAHIEQFLKFVHGRPNTDFEIRGLPAIQGDPVASGIFRSPRLAAVYALKMSTTLDTNVYFSLNAVTDAKNHPSTDKALPRVKHTPKDPSFSVRNAILLDFDPVRPSGTRASDEQLGAAKELALSTRDYLTSLGFPLPIVVCSGNGYHLLYKTLATPTTDEYTLAIKFFLRRLSEERSTEVVKIDRSVFNAGRISRLPGLVNKKAGRVAHVVEYPDAWLPAKVGLLAKDWGYVPPVKQAAASASGSRSKIAKLINLYPEVLHLDRVTQDGGKTYFSFNPCPVNGESHNGMKVGHGKSCIILSDDGAVGFSCFHDACAEHTFSQILRRCREVTGRPCTIRFFRDAEIDPEEFAADASKWGGVDDLDAPEPPSFWSLREAFAEKSTYQDAWLGSDPARQKAFRDRLQGIMRDRDVAAMAEYLGDDMVQSIQEWQRQYSRPVSAAEFKELMG